MYLLPSLYLTRVASTNQYYSNRHQIACFKVTAKSYNVATRTAESRRVKTSQRSKASNAALVTRGLEACNLVTVTTCDFCVFGNIVSVFGLIFT
jgi:hypothetical protein